MTWSHCTCMDCPIHQSNGWPRGGHEAVAYKAVLDGRLMIDQSGRIWRLGGKRAERQTNTGYLQVTVRVDGKQKSVLAHRLVWHHMVGTIPAGMLINHTNGDRTDNHPSNLELVTPQENNRHTARVLGRGLISSEARSASHDTVRDIRAMKRESD